MVVKEGKSGVSLISLIITIIVIIILAAVVIFSGMDTPEKAQLSKVISDIDNVQTAVDQAYYGLYTEKAVAGEVWTKSQFYEAVATGNTNREDLTATGLIEIAEDSLVDINLPVYEGRKWYIAVSDVSDTVKTGSAVLSPGFESQGKTYATLLDIQNGGSDGAGSNDSNGSDETFVAVEPTNVSDWTWEELEDGTLRILKYSGSDTEVVIPNSINGKRVTMLGTYIPFEEAESGIACENEVLWSMDICNIQHFIAYLYYPKQETIKKVIISSGIKKLGNYVFFNTINLQEVVLPNSIEYIGYGAFEDCTSLTNVTIPSSVEYIGWGAFKNISPSATITCHFSEKPEAWADNWNGDANVIWAGE